LTVQSGLFNLSQSDCGKSFRWFLAETAKSSALQVDEDFGAVCWDDSFSSDPELQTQTTVNS
jgi:hypothetical protein